MDFGHLQKMSAQLRKASELCWSSLEVYGSRRINYRKPHGGETKLTGNVRVPTEYNLALSSEQNRVIFLSVLWEISFKYLYIRARDDVPCDTNETNILCLISSLYKWMSCASQKQ